ncbi:MAG: hypothetical protein ABSF09_07190 [Candidatus Bathyarchaeia archaeon]|jgi:hypothetical protein
MADSNATPDRLRLLDAAEHVLSVMKVSRYQHATQVDETNGIYNFDCSGFVDYLLQQTLPDALAVIKYHPNRLNRPYHQDYYHFFASRGLIDNSGEWHTVRDPSNLLPGDVIAWLRPSDNHNGTGHVMIVRSNPTVDSKRSNEISVQIIDSTRSHHAFDSRVNGANGVGTGTISLVMNTNGNLVGFRWRDGQSTRIEYTRIAFGELGPRTSTVYGTLNSSSDQMLLAIIAVVIVVCAVVSTILVRKLRCSKSTH